MKFKSNNLLSSTLLALSAAALIFAPHGFAAEKDTLNATDVKFVKHAAAAGMAEVKVAELGVKKAGSPNLKAFAEMLVTDHTKANEEVTALAKTKGVELSTVIEPNHASTYQKLEQYSGTDFDKELLAVLVSDHKKCISTYEAAAKDSKDMEVKAWAEKMLPTLRTHLDKAKELSK